MKAAIAAISAMIWITGCNKEADRENGNAGESAAREAAEESREAGTELNEAGKPAGSKVGDGARRTGTDAGESGNKADIEIGEEARQTGRNVEGPGKVGDKIREESRQTGRDIREGADRAGAKAGEEARQTGRDLGEAMARGDAGKTDADRQLTARIRAALKADKDVAAEAGDVRIRTENGSVNLVGTVTSKDAKEDIARIAGDIAGKAKVDDDLKVAERVGAGTGDR